MPKEVRKGHFSRREELSDPGILSAIISRRDYYTDRLVDGRRWYQPRSTPASGSADGDVQFSAYLAVIRWYKFLRRYCSKAMVMPYVMHTNSIRIISIN